jgi:hypothetical protein
MLQLKQRPAAPVGRCAKAEGLQVPIELFEGSILDGRRRYLACRRAGVAPRFRDVCPADPVAYVLSLNFHRRHLSPTQAAMVGARARAIYDKRAKERMSEGGKAGGRCRPKQGAEKLPHPIPDPGDARDQVGEKVGVSGKTIDFATTVLNQGTPELIRAVDDDLIAVSTAAKASSLSEEEQTILVAHRAPGAGGRHDRAGFRRAGR